MSYADDLPEGRRVEPDVEHEIDHASADRPHELPHERVPLEVQPADDARTREALVRLNELESPQEAHPRVAVDVAPPERLGEVPAVVSEALEADDLEVLDRKRVDVDDLAFRSGAEVIGVCDGLPRSGLEPREKHVASLDPIDSKQAAGCEECAQGILVPEVDMPLPGVTRAVRNRYRDLALGRA